MTTQHRYNFFSQKTAAFTKIQYYFELEKENKGNQIPGTCLVIRLI